MNLSSNIQRNVAFHKRNNNRVCRTYSTINRALYTDLNENMFYIYYVGRYNSELIYHYGTSCDLVATEFQLHKKGIRKHIKCRYDIIDHHVWVEDVFENHVENLGIKRKIDELDNTFTINTDTPYMYVVSVLDDIFDRKYNYSLK
jgi:hypothetical protein